MNTLLQSDDEEPALRQSTSPRYGAGGGQEREITLGTTVVLGIFFGLAVLCAGFFGLGYSLGSKRSAPVAAAPAPQTSSLFNAFKPSSASPLNAAKAAPAAPAPVPYTPPVSASSGSVEPPPTPRPSRNQIDPADGMVVGDSSPAPAVKAPASAAPLTSATPASMVQIAAVSHQEDADLLVSTLQRRGYSVAIHSEPQDRLLHVQIGPFPTRKDAEAMRQKLLNDGFNAIIK